MKEIEEVLRELSQKEIIIPQQIDYRVNYTLKNKQRNEFYYKIRKLITTVSAIILVLLGTSGLVYGITSVYEYFTQETAIYINHSYNEEINMKKMNGFYYEKITNINDYLKYKDKMGNLIEMTEEDFKDNFLVIITTENSYMPGLYVYDIKTDDDTLYIEVDRSKDFENNIVVLSVKLKNELDRENINIDKMKQIPKFDGYVPLEELPEDYSKEQAISDNCVVIHNGEVISDNKSRIEEFIENTKNNKEDFIRIVRTQEHPKFSYNMCIFDIQYKNNEYITYIDQSRYDKSEISYELTPYYYTTFSKLIFDSSPDVYGNEYKTLVLINEFGETRTVVLYRD